jgi:hypothetical protein
MNPSDHTNRFVEPYWCSLFYFFTFHNVSPQISNADDSPGITPVACGTDPINEVGVPVFEVKDIPGKGKGLTACVNIAPGTLIICERPLLTAQPMPPNELERMLAAGLKVLPKTSQRQFLSLHNNFPGKYPFSNTFKTNALPCGSGSSVGSVYPTICFINHSCVPNAHNNWDSKAEHETIYAIRPIRAGEEITVSYDRGGPSEERRVFLKESFGFKCDCRGCVGPPSELEESNVRRLAIESLDEAIGDPYRMATMPEKSLHACQLLLEVLDEEYGGYAGILNARVYYDAFQVCIAHGDQARASVFAEKSYEARLVCEGENSPETQRLKDLALTPTAHFSFGMCSMRWKTSRERIPKELDQPRLQAWLFARVCDEGVDSNGVLSSSSEEVDSDSD